MRILRERAVLRAVLRAALRAALMAVLRAVLRERCQIFRGEKVADLNI